MAVVARGGGRGGSDSTKWWLVWMVVRIMRKRSMLGFIFFRLLELLMVVKCALYLYIYEIIYVLDEFEQV